jgi:Zn-dependent peptidase ImmA (M78 family)
VSDLARALRYPERFFEQTDPRFGLGNSFLFHRKRQAMPVAEVRRLEAEINIFRMRINRLMRGLDFEHDNEFVTYEVDEDGTPEEIAQMVRAGWKLPAGPVRNLTAAIESAGGIVVLTRFHPKVDGISAWVTPTPPLFFLNDRAPADRTRWTLAHEAGHVIMHRQARPDIEPEADRFASELLMPAADIRDDLSNLTLPKAAALKLEWRVSIQALVRRARDVGAIPSEKYKSLCVQISKAGIRRNEPNPIAPEAPQNLRAILGTHRIEHGYGNSELSEIALAFPDEFDELFACAQPGLRIAK